MLTAAGPQVLEFNCRLGDPETQAIMAQVDFDLAEVLEDAANGRLDAAKLKWKPGASVCVVAASGGYPGKFESGKEIRGLTDLTNNTGVKVLHAGTKKSGDAIVAAGGRVLGVTTSGDSLDTALARAYAAMEKIKFDGMHFRRDIGLRRNVLMLQALNRVVVRADFGEAQFVLFPSEPLKISKTTY